MSDTANYTIRWGPEKNGKRITVHLIRLTPDGDEQEVGQIGLDPQELVEGVAVSTFMAMHLMPRGNVWFEHEHLENQT